jgi:hypothetical protein
LCHLARADGTFFFPHRAETRASPRFSGDPSSSSASQDPTTTTDHLHHWTSNDRADVLRGNPSSAAVRRVLLADAMEMEIQEHGHHNISYEDPLFRYHLHFATAFKQTKKKINTERE